MSLTAQTVVTPRTPHLGAVVEGLDLCDGPLEEAQQFLRQLLDRHLVLVVRNQSLSARQLRDLVAGFGPLFQHHADEGVLFCEGLPEVLEMRKEADGARLFGGSDWHADVTFRSPAGYLSALQSVILPPVGGDTAFTSTIAACHALSDRMRQMLADLVGVHSYDGPGQPDHPSETARHPVVRTHPVTGERGLYLNRMFVTRFEGMTSAESRPLIDWLDGFMTQPEFGYRHRWQPGDLVLWDNRFTLHYPINDFTGHARLLLRCTALES